jgi:hypothetical protein
MNYSGNTTINALCDSSMQNDSSFTAAEMFMMSDCFGPQQGGYKSSIRRMPLIVLAPPSPTAELELSSSRPMVDSGYRSSDSLPNAALRSPFSRLHTPTPTRNQGLISSLYGNSGNDSNAPVGDTTIGLHPVHVESNIALSQRVDRTHDGRLRPSVMLTNNFGGACAA